MAAYSVVSYVLQIKDRHNGNMLIDEDGHIIHIGTTRARTPPHQRGQQIADTRSLSHADFGFIFDIVPGGNIATFEVSPFKLSSEMLDLLGGKIDSAPFKEFMKYVTQGFLAVREHTESIITIVALMMDTSLNCFNTESLNSLRTRLCGGKSEKDAVKHITYVASQALSFLSSSTTYVYDVFQNMYVRCNCIVVATIAP